MKPRYPLAHVTYGEEEVAAVNAALLEGRTTMGNRVDSFEQRFAERVGARHAIMVNSGSSADLLCAFGLGPPHPGLDEVLVPAVTWPTQVWACTIAGYKVRLVDVDPDTLQMNLDDLERKIGLRTRAIFATHVLGNTCDLDRLVDLAKTHSLPLLEDCCEALGTLWTGQPVGTFGQAAAFSFFFSHLLSTMEGGMVVTDDMEAAQRYRLWRSHGWEPKPTNHFFFPSWGLNLRPTELQGAFGGVQLGKVHDFLAARKRNYDRLRERLPFPLEVPWVLPECTPAWHGFPLTVSWVAPFDKMELCAYLNARGIETRPLIAGNLARQPAVVADKRVIGGTLPGADAVHDRSFYIGLASFDDPEGTGYVAETLHAFMETQK